MLANTKRKLKWLGILLTPFLLFVIYTFMTLHWVYSEGERAGVVEKISEKGLFCKTYEGELALVTTSGMQAEKFYFTAKNAAVYNEIDATIGQRVSLVYKQHRWIPSTCFGETEYFVSAVRVLENQDSNGSD